MYDALLEYLACPACHSSLTLTHHHRDARGEILQGQLHCNQCQRSIPINEGIVDVLGTPRITSLAHAINELPPAAWGYERLWRPFALSLLSGERFGFERELPLVLDMADPEQSGLVLDIACSAGLYARALARRLGGGGHVAAVDHTWAMVREARERARAQGLQISFVRARAQQLPFRSACVASITIGGSLNEIGDLEACLTETRRALAPGAVFAAMTLTRHPRPFESAIQRLMEPGGVRFWTADQLIGYFETHGLHVVQREQYGIVLFTQAVAA